MSTIALAEFLASLEFERLPTAVVTRTKELFIDWLGCTLAGKGAEPVHIIELFAKEMGPGAGPSEVLSSRERSSPLFAALINAAASHVVEQDDLHNASILHPATVVFPAALATAQAVSAGGEKFLTACVAGYEAATRAGEFLGPSHYRTFHTTGTAGTLGASAAVARLLDADGRKMGHALGSAGTQAAGLWEFLRDGAYSKQLHTAKAAADGLLAAYLARDGFSAARRILEGPQGMGAGMSEAPDPEKLTDRLGDRWAVCETSIKFHACCRHTHPAADALAKIVREQRIGPDQIESIRVRVYQAAADVLGPVTEPRTVHQSKFSMGFVLALIAARGRAGVNEFNDAALRDPMLADLRRRVEMIVDPEIDRAYPERWSSVVEVVTKEGEQLVARIDVPKGDPENPLSRDELEAKAMGLAAYRKAATRAEMQALIDLCWNLEEIPAIGFLLPPAFATALHPGH